MTLACLMAVCLVACGGDDDGSIEQPKEPSVDELLSEETTPITFRLESKGTHFLFDYAGSHLVGADTIEVEYAFQKSHKIDLRQGKHRLLWMIGLSGTTIRGENHINKVEDIDYDPTSGMVVLKNDEASFYPEPKYCIKDMEITPYLMPEQKVEYNYLCATLSISLESGILYASMVYAYNVPFVSAVDVVGSRYDVQYRQYNVGSGWNGEEWRTSFSYHLLCPEDGLNDIQLEYEVFVLDDDGNRVSFHKQQLPKISLHRGFMTEITGPLFGSKQEDFGVTTKPYGERY